MADDYTFESHRWTSELMPLDCTVGYIPPATSPRGAVYLECLRAQIASRCDLGPSVETDTFVLGWGKSPHRDMTKIDGVPYRPADSEWPVSSDGEPMTFLAQYRFVESTDIIGQLPGDLLLVFIQDHMLEPDSPQEFLRFEWHPAGLRDLCVPGALPDPAWMFASCYGVRHRTVDYLQDMPVDLVRQFTPQSTSGDYFFRRRAATFSRVLGMKIGGLPTFPYDAYQKETIAPNARLLCSLSSVYPDFGMEYPWVNVREPIVATAPPTPEMCLDFMDGFVLDIWMDDCGDLSWVVSFD
jgi:hypothetical protein